MNPILIIIPILAVLMFSIGLSLKSDDFKKMARQPLPIAIGMFGQILLLPVLALTIATILRLPAEFAVGLVLISCCPGGSSSNIFSKLSGGDVALSVSLTALSSIITMFTLPFFMAMAMGLLSDTVTEIHLPVGAMFGQNVILMLVPILLGAILRKTAPVTAGKVDNMLSRVAFPALILLASIFFIQHYETFAHNFQSLWLSVTLLLILSMTIGGMLSKMFGLQQRVRRTLVIEIGMQNAAQAIAVATSPFVLANDIIAVPAIVYSLMMNIILLGYVYIIRQQNVASKNIS